MRNANTKMIRFWHFHTDTSRAGPTRLQKYIASRKPKLLRTTAPKPPPPYTISTQWKATKPEIATMTLHTIRDLNTFLSAYYKTKSGFKYKKDSLDIQSLSQSLVLLLRNPEGQICGCVISSEIHGLFGFKNETKQPMPRIIQYICIHPLLRGRGLAGWLLAWLDTFTHEKYGACSHIGWWFAPSSYKWSPLPSIVQTKLYKKVLPDEPLRTYEAAEITEVTSESAKRVLDELLSEKVDDWLGHTSGTSIEMYNISSKQIVYWWKYTNTQLHGCSVLIGLAPTTLEAPEGQIWQVVYCGYVRSRPGNVNDISMPFWDDSPTYKYVPKLAIELALAAQGVNVVIVSNIPSQYGGGLQPSRWNDWTQISERSKLILYNWMPPSFDIEDCLWIAPTV